MKVTIVPYGDRQLETDGAIFKNKEAVENFIKALQAAAEIVWPPENKK